MFGSHSSSHKKQPGCLFTVFRLFLSLVVLLTLLVVGYKALVNFSGYDPLKISPSTISSSLINSPEIYKIVTKILSFDPTHTLSKVANGTLTDTEKPKGNLVFKYAVISDSHNDNENLAKALAQAKAADAKFIIYIGDFSDVGTIEELEAAKTVLDNSDLPYYTTAGDHDLWDARNKGLDPLSNYSQVFGSAYTSFGYGEYRFVILFNSDNYLGIDDIQQQWLEQELERVQGSKALFVLTATPFFHPSSDHVYGKVDPKFKGEANEFIDLFKKYNVAEVFAGDVHFYTSYVEPRTGLHMTTVGAVTSTRNAQSPRFALVDVYESGAYTVVDTEIQ